jgi:hypothetical protein
VDAVQVACDQTLESGLVAPLHQRHERIVIGLRHSGVGRQP